MTLRRLVPFRASGATPTGDEFVRAQQEAQRVTDALWDTTVKSMTRQILTGSGTYKKPDGCVAQRIRGWGGGGGGGGAQDNTTWSAGGGGAAGGYAEVFLATAIDKVAYSCGSGGAAGPASAVYPIGNGGGGGDTTFGSVLLAKGGQGGECGQNFSTYLAFPGIPSLSGGIGDIVGGGQTGTWGVNIASVQIFGGNGGSSDVGTGGNLQGVDGNGYDGTGFAAGGGGAMASSNPNAHKGGKGSPGLIIIEELY